MYRIDITADLNDEDDTGYLWTFVDEARDPGQIKPGALVVAGDEDTAAVCHVVDLAPGGDGTIVHLRLLPGLVDDYRQLVERALASQRPGPGSAPPQFGCLSVTGFSTADTARSSRCQSADRRISTLTGATRALDWRAAPYTRPGAASWEHVIAGQARTQQRTPEP